MKIALCVIMLMRVFKEIEAQPEGVFEIMRAGMTHDLREGLWSRQERSWGIFLAGGFMSEKRERRTIPMVSTNDR